MGEKSRNKINVLIERIRDIMVYKTHGVCSDSIDIQVNEIEGKKYIKSVRFFGGCNGNLTGISKLIEGRELSDVITTLEGVTCGFRNTSCPDQLAKALKQIV